MFRNLVTIAIFYGLPVLHLVIAYQTVYSKSGNEDMCYYNFWCAKPYWVFASFNNVFSNIGYIMLGLLFYLITYQRHVNYRLRVEIDSSKKNQGIPKHFGLFYAIGIALTMEGVMSGCYHVCPNWFNFQFDVSFMYMIAGLGMLRMYQSRHPDVNANAHSAFFVFAIVVAISVLGTLFNESRLFWSFFVALYLFATLYLTCQIYFLGTVKLDTKIFQRALVFCRTEYFVSNRSWRQLIPSKPDRFLLLLMGNIINWAFAIYGLVTLPRNFGTYLVAIFIVNLIGYFFFYIIMKMRIGEKVYYLSFLLGSLNICTWIAAIFFFMNASSNWQLRSGERVQLFNCVLIAVGTVFWCLSAAVFFLRESTRWQLSPAESREMNKECELLSFYDYHDIWHFLSALSLFISFLVVLILDDDLDSTERTHIKVF